MEGYGGKPQHVYGPPALPEAQAQVAPGYPAAPADAKPAKKQRAPRKPKVKPKPKKVKLNAEEQTQLQR
jgi:hypothetical protein